MIADAYQRAVAYFRNQRGDPWRWTEDGRVIVWADGTTVSFREEVVEILEGLAPDGLPPFQAVMVLLAACRGKFPHPAPDSSSTDSPPATVPPPGDTRFGQMFLRFWDDPASQEFSELLAHLRALHELPSELRTRPAAKAVLIESVFEANPEKRVQPARDIIQVLREGGLAEQVLNYPAAPAGERSNSDSTWIANLKFLRHRLASLSPESLALRMRTGLDALPGEADVDLRPAERVRQLLAQVRDDPSLEGLAKVTRDVMAAIYLPRALSEMDELALGGFSDISNRGSLDRLLPSELANDDLTLAARIALNEALYFRREPPANHPPGRFAVLLDAGVRTWGLPRVFATAVGLALLGREDRRGEVTTWRASLDGVERIDLLSREGLVEHLSILQTNAHPGASLAPFFARLAGEPEIEAVLVTQRDTLADPEFQACLRAVDSRSFYIATVDRDGAFEMFQHPHAHSLLCQAAIPLENLFAAPRATASLQDEHRAPDLPLILSLRPFPFLLPVDGPVQKAIRHSAAGGIAVMQDRRLLRWEGPGRGAETLAEHLPQGRTLWLGASEFGSKIHVLKQRLVQPTALLTTWSATSGDVRTHELSLPDKLSLRAYVHNGVIFLVNRLRILGYEIETGRMLGSACPPNARLTSSGKYFRRANAEFVFAAYDGRQLQFLPVTLKPFLPPKDILVLFDREGLEGPWILTVHGEIYSNAGERVVNLGRNIQNFEISQDGHRLLVPSITGSPGFQLIDLENNKCIVMTGEQARMALEPPILPPTANLRRHFDAIHLPVEGGISLRDAEGFWLHLDPVGKDLVLRAGGTPWDVVAGALPLEPLPLPSHFAFRLNAAVWPDGRRAWLDSRGLLHLKSSEASAPEVSFVLSEDRMAAWSSDGSMAGDDFFMPSTSTKIPVEDMMARVLQFSPGW